MNFKSNNSTKASFFQRYPIVCWTNAILILMIVAFSIMNYLTFYEIDYVLIAWMRTHPKKTLLFAFGFFILVGAIVIVWLIIKSKMRVGNEDQ